MDLYNKITKLEKRFIGLDESGVKLGPEDDQTNTEFSKILGDLENIDLENINDKSFSEHRMG